MIPSDSTHGTQRGRRRRARLAPLILTVPLLAAAASCVRAEEPAHPSPGDLSITDLTAMERTALVEEVCARIEEIYPFEEIGRKTREGLLHRLHTGDYDNITSRAEFASRITGDMEDLSRDRHLDLYYNPALALDLLAQEDAGEGQTGPPPSEVENARWENFGFKDLRMLDGRVGYLDLRMFFAARHAGPTAVAAMEFLSLSQAVIIDLRRNGGGWDDMVTLLAGYFVDLEEPVVLALNQSTLDQSYDASVVSAFTPGKTLTGIPVYLLTSPSTASAAEAFASILKHLNKEVTTVGQKTAGAENPVNMVPLNDQFVLKIPCFKKIYFGSRSGWEGIGLVPDIEVPSVQALETAHLHALRTLQERLTDDTAREKLQWGIDGIRASLEPETVPLDLLRSYAGLYRGVHTVLDGNDLFMQFNDQSRRRLLAVSQDYFLLEGRDDLRLRFVETDGKITAVERIYSDGYRMLDVRE